MCNDGTACEWADKYINLSRQHNEAMKAIYERQRREADAWRDEWRTVDGDRPADERHESAWAFHNSHDAAAEAARFDWREVQHRRVTDWQTVHTAHHDNI